MTLVELVARARCLLIDFDGPICSVFAGHPAATVAARLHAVVRDRYGNEMSPSLVRLTDNPLSTLVQVAAIGDDALTHAVIAACRNAEVDAAATAMPTAGAVEVLRAAKETERAVVIVSNNATAAINAYLRRHHLDQYVDAVAARADNLAPSLLKPDPYLLKKGMTAVEAVSRNALFVGDSVTDIHAGRAAGVPTIGYANKSGKRQRLGEAGAELTIESMYEIADAIQMLTTEPTQ